MRRADPPAAAARPDETLHTPSGFGPASGFGAVSESDRGNPFAAAASPHGATSWLTWLPNALLTTDTTQRLRLTQCGLALLLLAAGVAAMHYFVWIGSAPRTPVAWWAAASLGGMVVFYGLIRSGWSRRLGDASLAVPQMLYAISSGVVAYALLGEGRGGVFPIVMVVLMFGMFGASPRQMLGVSLYAVAAFAAVMAGMAMADPARYPPAVEMGHFLMVATMMPAVALLAARISRMRHRARAQRAELAQALARIRELATRDESTGLINQRHMHELLAQEHQRCVRSGQTFCIALLEAGSPGMPCCQAEGDAVVQALAQEAQRQVRVSDLLARWGSGCFLLLMPDTRAAMARGGLERLHLHLSTQVPMPAGAQLTAALVEHIAGESVTQTLARAERALCDIQAQGGGRIAILA
jgi:diguanylate cyclase (GGDEF)-like protein